MYKYPDIYVCLYSFYGCDTLELEEKCRDSTHSTEGGRSTAIYNPTREDEQILQVDAVFSEEVIPTCSFGRAGGKRCCKPMVDRSIDDRCFAGSVG